MMYNLSCWSFEFLSFIDLNKARSWLYLLGGALISHYNNYMPNFSFEFPTRIIVGNPSGKVETFSFIVVGPSMLLELVPQYLQEHGIRI